MTSPIVFGFLTVLAAAATLATRKPWLRTTTFCALLCAAVGLWQVSLGNPRTFSSLPAGGTVVSISYDEPRAIYLWVIPQGGTAPVAYALPWDEGKASVLQGQQAAVQATHGKLVIDDKTHEVYHEEPHALPLKEHPKS